MSVTHCLVNGADRGAGLLRQKTQVGGRSSRAVVARPMVCSALGGEPRGDRENPRQQRCIIKYDREVKSFTGDEPSGP